jgi:hypothetical protein
LIDSVLCNDAVSTVQIYSVEWFVNDELEGMWKEVMVSFVLVFWYLIGETEETHVKTKLPVSEVKI